MSLIETNRFKFLVLQIPGEIKLHMVRCHSFSIKQKLHQRNNFREGCYILFILAMYSNYYTDSYIPKHDYMIIPKLQVKFTPKQLFNYKM